MVSADMKSELFGSLLCNAVWGLNKRGCRTVKVRTTRILDYTVGFFRTKREPNSIRDEVIYFWTSTKYICREVQEHCWCVLKTQEWDSVAANIFTHTYFYNLY